MKLRDYQVDAVESVKQRLAAPGSSTLGVAATGMGKTVVLVTVADHFAQNSRVLIIAHRAELIHQAAGKVSAMTDHQVEIEMAADRANSSRFWKGQIVVASKDSLRNRLDTYNPDDFGLIITDEAHHAVASSYRKVYDHFKSANPSIRHLGVTATPDRLDGAGLRRVYETVAFNYDIKYGITNGWLVDIRQRQVHIQSVDFSHVGTVAGDFNAGQLEAELTRDENVWGMAHAIMEQAGSRKTLVFTASVRHAELMSQIIQTRSNGEAATISGKTPKEQREATLRRFRDGEIQFLVNVDVFTEGFDEPSIEVVAMCRPTKSRAKYVQMLGRGTRVLPGVVDAIDDRQERLAAIMQSSKRFVDVIDFVGVTGRHKLVTTMDILGDGEADETIELAKLIQQKNPEKSGSDAIELAKEEIEEKLEKQRALEAEKLRKVQARVRYREGAAIDAFNILDMTPMDTVQRIPVPATEAQVNTLRKFGVPNPESMSKREASRLIGECIQRRRDGMATFGQVRKLREYGQDASRMSFEEASAAIDEIARNGWKKVLA